MHRSEFRYLVVGGGSAGCLLARELAAKQEGRVALVEAGGQHRDVRTIVPKYYPLCFGGRFDWQWTTSKQTALNGRQLAWPRGKLLGGSGAINALIYLQPSTADLQRWGLEIDATLLQPIAEDDGGWRCPLSGLRLEDRTDCHRWAEAFLQSASESGLQRTSLWHRSRPNCCGTYLLTARNGRRCDTGNLLKSDIENGSLNNLDTLCDVQVQKIVFDQARACGIECIDRYGNTFQLRAEEEVILTGGTIGSPLLLMRSGIGPAQHLADSGVSCHVDLPAVGQNLQDHLVFPLVYRTPEAAGLPYRVSAEQRTCYRHSGTGPLASNIAEAGAISPSGEYQIHFTATHYLKFPRTRQAEDCFSLGISDLHPRSRGAIRLSARRNKDGLGGLEIDPAYLQEEADQRRMLEAVCWARELVHREPLASLAKTELLPGQRRQNARSILRSITTLAQSIYHPVGTCCMAGLSRTQPDSTGEREENRSESVVDRQFRVHGVCGLRIADASVLADLPSGNTNAATLLIAKLAAASMLPAESNSTTG